MAFRSNYWSGSKLADWIRGTSKPEVATCEGWDDFEEACKKERPVRYWIAEEGLNYIQNFVYYIPDKLGNLRYYLNNRWISRYHVLTANPRDIEPGRYADFDSRILFCLFNELQNFVEIELAWKHCACDKEEAKKYMLPWYRKRPFGLRTWRSKDAGLAHLNWEISLVYDEDWGSNPRDENYGKPTHQSIAAKEILELYTWWTTAYRNRPDPYDASGWSDFCDERLAANDGKWSDRKTPSELTAKGDVCHKKLREIEEAYKKEEEEMLIRLIKIRENMWT
jgi:hypothetical protein